LLARELNELSDPEVGRKRLSGRFGGHDFSQLPLDRPLAPEDFPEPGAVEAARSRTEVILSLVRREKPPLPQLLARLPLAPAQLRAASRLAWTFGPRPRGRPLPTHAPGSSRHSGWSQGRSDPAIAAARAFPRFLCGEDPARTLWAGVAAERLRRGAPARWPKN